MEDKKSKLIALATCRLGLSYMPSPNQSLKPVKSWSWGDLADPEPVVRGRILALIDYLNRIQEK